MAINYHADLIAVKMPAGHASSRPTGFHQDWVNFPFDRTGFLTFWIALDDITAAQGSMRFHNGSHRAGQLGKMGLDGVELPQYYADIPERYPLSDPIDLAQGDATIHNGMVVHGAPENTTDRPRWTLIIAYHPADTCYTGAPHHIFKPELGSRWASPSSTSCSRPSTRRSRTAGRRARKRCERRPAPLPTARSVDCADGRQRPRAAPDRHGAER